METEKINIKGYKNKIREIISEEIPKDALPDNFPSRLIKKEDIQKIINNYQKLVLTIDILIISIETIIGVGTLYEAYKFLNILSYTQLKISFFLMFSALALYVSIKGEEPLLAASPLPMAVAIGIMESLHNESQNHNIMIVLNLAMIIVIITGALYLLYRLLNKFITPEVKNRLSQKYIFNEYTGTEK